MRYVIFSILTLFVSPIIWSQKSTIEKRRYSMNSREFDANRVKFLHAHKLYTYDFFNCRLISVERDLTYNLVYYVFQGDNSIYFNVVEYCTEEQGDTTSHIYNIPFLEATKMRFDISATAPSFVSMKNALSGEEKYNENHRWSSFVRLNSNRRLIGKPPYLFVKSWRSINTDTTDLIKPRKASRFDKIFNSSKVDSMQLNAKGKIVSIDLMDNTEFIMYTFYVDSIVEDLTLFNYTLGHPGFLYVVSQKPLLDQENQPIDVIFHKDYQFELTYNQLVSSKLKIYHVMLSGRIIGGEQFKLNVIEELKAVSKL